MFYKYIGIAKVYLTVKKFAANCTLLHLISFIPAATSCFATVARRKAQMTHALRA
jgi:hypothetical protein